MSAPSPIKVLVVDDSAFMRKAIVSMLKGNPDIEIVGEARDGQEGVEMAVRLRPDVMTLDVEMPRLDGLSALQKIMSDAPTHVIMLSSLTNEGSHAAMTALRVGAADVMAKDASQVSFTITSLKDELLAKVRALGTSRRPHARRPGVAKVSIAPTDVPRFSASQFELLCIGSSTGGPPVLETILTSLPANLRIPVVVAQHMPELFTRSMAERLGQSCRIPVKHVDDGMSLEPGGIYISPGGKNTHVRRAASGRMRLEVNREPAGTIYFPSVDALLASAAEAVGARTLAVVLTGMGEDGLKGGRLLKAKGGTLLAQSEETCVVYGMPRAVTVAGLIAASLSPDGLVAALASLSASGSGAAGGAAEPLRRAG